MYVIAHWESASALKQLYVSDWMLRPNMAMELTVPLLAQVMPIYMAGKIFIAATLLLLLGGTIALRKTLHGAVGLWPAVTFLLLYNYVLLWGFLNYLFAAALALLAFSAWIALRRRGPLPRAAVFGPAAVVLYISHLFGLLVYGLMVLGYEIWRTRRIGLTRRGAVADWAVAGAQFIAPGLLFLHWQTATYSSDHAITSFGPLSERLVALMSPVYVGLPWIDFPAALLLACGAVMLRGTRGTGFSAELKLPIALLFAVALAMPTYLADVWGTHIRLPIVIACLAVAGLRIGPEARRAAAFVAGAVVVTFCLRTAVITQAWTEFDRAFGEFRAASTAIEPGSRILPLEDDADRPAGKLPIYGMQYWNLTTLAVIERSAFVPILFTGHTPVHATPARQAIDTPAGVPIDRAMLQANSDPATARFPLGHHFSRFVWNFWTGWPAQYDYVVSVRFANRENPDPKHLQPVIRGSYFDIYRIIEPAPAAR